MKKIAGLVFVNFVAALLAFVPIAIAPFDDPLLLGGIAILRAMFGLWGGYIIFCLLWGGIGEVTLALYQLGINFKPLKWLEKMVATIGGKYSGEVVVKTGWRGRIARVRSTAARMGADRTFVTVALGPVFAVPICHFWGWKWKDPLTTLKMLLLGFIFGSVWYLWYAGIIWPLVAWIF